jgi:acyl-coenzyme A synthetase/AMP-(fatty) acid ligase/acyl carrier protein
VTRFLVVPALLRMLLESGREIGLELPSLSTWFTSGEALTPELAQQFAAFVPDGRLFNLYGSSEVAGDVTAGEWTGGEVVDIGRPIANTSIYILDDRLEPVPAGVPGRVHAAGANLARGYHRRPALTAAAFLPDPFSAVPGARMYDTGDRGRWRPDGTIEYLGRRDHQVKVRGARVELGQVEQVLLSYPGVRGVAAVLEGHGHGDVRLVAYVEADVREQDLRSHARARLPGYMVPATIVLLDRLPVRPNGKIDRRALRSTRATEIVDELEAPATEAERRLCGLWSSLLNVERIGRDADFFDLGGHSLLATRLVSLVRDQFGVELPLATIFEHPTLEAMAAALEKALHPRLVADTPAAGDRADDRREATS